jgi:hypothetical protein
MVLLPTVRVGPFAVSWTPVTMPETWLPFASVPLTWDPSIAVAAPAC